MTRLTRNQLDQQQRLQPEVTEQSDASPDITTISAQLTQIIAIMATMTTRMEAFKARYRPPTTSPSVSLQTVTHQFTQQSTPPASKRQSAQPITKPIAQEKAQKEKKQEPQSLHQATVKNIAEDIAESTTEKETEQHDMVTSKPDSDSTLSTIPRLCTKPFSGDPAACLSNALNLACQHFLAWHSFLLSYIEYSKGMEATEQGWMSLAEDLALRISFWSGNTSDISPFDSFHEFRFHGSIQICGRKMRHQKYSFFSNFLTLHTYTASPSIIRQSTTIT